MTRSITWIAVAVLALGLATTAAAQEQSTTVTRAPATEKPGGTIVNEIHATAVVKAIDYKLREITVALPSGEARSFAVSEDAVNFPQVKVGDSVDIAYVESLAVAVLGPAEQSASGAGAAVALAPVGTKPGGVVVATKKLTARVVKIDQEKRLVTLTGPEGNTRTLEVGPEVKRLSEIRVGDQVTFQYTEALMLDVRPSAPAAPKQ